MQTRIREIRGSDIPRTIEIVKRVFPLKLDVNSYKRNIIEYFSSQSYPRVVSDCVDQNLIEGQYKKEVLFVLEVDGQVVGVSGYYPDEYDTPGVLWLHWTAIDPEYQRKGYGTGLLKEVERRAKDEGAQRLYIDSASYMEGAHSFYTKNGYTEEWRLRDYYGSGEDRIIFKKILPSADASV